MLERLYREAGMYAERFRAPARAARLTPDRIAGASGFQSVDEWWSALGAQPYLGEVQMNLAAYDGACPGDSVRIFEAADRAARHKVALLGSGDVDLGSEIDWSKDYKSGYSWPPGYFADLRYGAPNARSDVKFPWELSRLQWMIPLGQAYALTGEERYAATARELLESWISANPHGRSINWSCTMEVALRIISLSWFFRVFNQSRAWNDQHFRGEFLRAMYLHADFTARHLEKSDVNGNHYTADAAGLVYAGLFFKGCPGAAGWLQSGWDILAEEIQKQVHEDGVDFEASVPYHRLVQELFLLPALYRKLHGQAIPSAYRDRLVAMARYTASYCRPDGTVPLIGDADDARALPLGGQSINDHRYLVALAGLSLGAEDLLEFASGPRGEIAWLLGLDSATAVPSASRGRQQSRAFPNGGYFVFRNEEDHVFVCCAPLGLAGRGGHSHNDILSVDAVLLGAHLFSDCGAYVYTADYGERNRFRSTAYHNTPRIDGEEANRLVSPDFLWSLHYDAVPTIRSCEFSAREDRIVVSHSGYKRLAAPVTPVRTVVLNHLAHRLRITDEFLGESDHLVEIPLHLAPGVRIVENGPGVVTLGAGRSIFSLTWTSAAEWTLETADGRVSPSYGVVVPAQVLVWRREGSLASLTIEAAAL